jgi:hypothetical protein
MTKHNSRSGLTGSGGAVRRLMKQSDQRQREKQTKGRGRAGHGGKRGLDKTGRAKMTIDLPLDIQQGIRGQAKEIETFPKDLVALACARLLKDIETGEIDLLDYMQPSDHPRVACRLALEPVHIYSRPEADEDEEEVGE